MAATQGRPLLWKWDLISLISGFARGPPESGSGPPGIPFCSEVIRRRGWTPSAAVENEFVGWFYHAKELIPEGFVWRCRT